MAVTEEDVRHIAALARLGLEPGRVDALVHELNGILEHMSALQSVDTERVQPVQGVGAAGMPLRVDRGPRYPMAHPLEHLAPSMRDGFLLVPRLTTHEHLEGSEGADLEAPE